MVNKQFYIAIIIFCQPKCELSPNIFCQSPD